MEAATSQQHRHISSHHMVAVVEKEEVSRQLSLLAAPRATSSTIEATRLMDGPRAARTAKGRAWTQTSVKWAVLGRGRLRLRPSHGP